MSLPDQKRAEEAAEFLLACRAADAAPAEGFPSHLRPGTLADAIQIQLATLRVLGPIGGWKVGAPDPQGTPVASPLPLRGIHRSPGPGSGHLRGIEAEISFTFAHALPPADRAYGADDVLRAVGSCQAAIEVLDPRFQSSENPDALTLLADLGMHEALVVGPPIASWDMKMFPTLGVRLVVDDALRCEARGSNPGGTDLMRLLVWLANADVVRAAGGIRAGAVVTTGSWSGCERVPVGGVATASFEGFPPVTVRFES